MASLPTETRRARRVAGVPVYALVLDLARWALVFALLAGILVFYGKAHGQQRTAPPYAQPRCYTSEVGAIKFWCDSAATLSNDPAVQGGVFDPPVPVRNPANVTGAKPYQNWNGALMGERK